MALALAAPAAPLRGLLGSRFLADEFNLDVIFEQPYRAAKIEAAALAMPGVMRVESYHATSEAYRLRPNGSQSQNFSAVGLDPASSIFHLPVIAGRWLSAGDRQVVVIN